MPKSEQEKFYETLHWMLWGAALGLAIPGLVFMGFLIWALIS